MINQFLGDENDSVFVKYGKKNIFFGLKNNNDFVSFF